VALDEDEELPDGKPPPIVETVPLDGKPPDVSPEDEVEDVLEELPDVDVVIGLTVVVFNESIALVGLTVASLFN